MAFDPPAAVHALGSYAEAISWAMGAYAPRSGPMSLLEVSGLARKRRFEFVTGAIDYEDVPGHMHAAWFMRASAFGTRDVNELRRRSKLSPEAEKLFNEMSVGARNYFIKESEYDLERLAEGALIPDDVKAWLHDEAPLKGKMRQADGYRRFNPQRVRDAIQAIREIVPPGPPQAPELPVQPIVPDRPLSDLGSRTPRLLLTARGHPMAACLSGDHVVMTGATWCDPGVLVAPDVTLVAHLEEGGLQVSRINRVSTAVAAWPSRVDLSGLGDGEVLSIGAAGARDLGFVWASDGGTDLYRATPGNEVPTLRGRLTQRRAAAAVLRGAQALLAVPEQGRARSGAFPGLAIETLTAAHSGGRLLVLATGTDPSGRPVVAVEQDGRHVTVLDGGDAFLTFDLARQTVPSLVTADGANVLLSQGVQAPKPYSHWLPSTPSREYASA